MAGAADVARDHHKLVGFSVGAVVLIVLGFAVYLLWRVGKGVGNIAENVVGGIDGVSKGVKGVGEGVGGVGSEVKDILVPISPSPYNPDVDVARPTLRISVLSHINKNPGPFGFFGGTKKNHVTVLVTSSLDNKPVLNATVRVEPAVANNSILDQGWKAAVRNISAQRWVTDQSGVAALDLNVPDSFGDADDDFFIWAQYTGMNDSRKVLVQ